MSELFLSLVNRSITAGWIVLCVIALRLLLGKAPKHLRVALWGLVALRLALPFSIESALSLIPSAETIHPQILLSPSPAIHSGILAVNSAVNPIIGGSFTPAVGASVNPLQIWVSAAAVIWLTGVAALTVYAAFSYLRLRRRVKTATLLKENIYQSENVSSPFVLGIFRPRIYLPFGCSAMENVIAHEKAHIQRRDHILKPIGYLLLTVYWFHPLLWVAYALLCRDIELACDEKVIRDLGHGARADYSEALLACSVPRRQVAACPLAFGEVGVKQRVKNVLNYKKPAFWLIVVAVVACVVVAVCFLTNPPSPPVSFDTIEITWAQALDCRPNEPISTDLSSTQLETLKSRLQDLNVGRRDSTFGGLTSMYSLTVQAQGAPQFSIHCYDIAGKKLALNCEGKYYRIDDIGFARYLGSVCAATAASRPLTLGDVIRLAQKGDALTWSDFDGYDYIETGSGLYIRVYETDDRFSLWIGGSSSEKPPAYIYLADRENQDDHIDIRTEDVEAFLLAHRPDPLDAAVTAAILSHNASGNRESDFACESHVTLATVSANPKVGESAHAVTVYAMVLYQAYDLSGAPFLISRGSHIPTALTFAVSADGKYTLTEYWIPRDGSYYAPDIRAKFPADIAADALDTQKYILAQEQNCYAQAVAYGKIDTDAVIAQLLKAITSSPAASSNPADYVDAHPIEYRELTYYGDYMLRYVFGEFLLGGQTDLRGHIMRRVMDDLIGGEALGLYADNGQVYFDEWRAHAERLCDLNGDAFMQEHAPKSWLMIQMTRE